MLTITGIYETKERQLLSDTEFRNLNGRVYISKSNDRRLIIAVNGSDFELKEYFTDRYNATHRIREIFFTSTNFEKVEFNELLLTQPTLLVVTSSLKTVVSSPENRPVKS